MAGQVWTIMITSSGGTAQFVPDIPNPPLQAQQNDLICWNNQTNEQHQPATSSGTLCEVIDPFSSNAKAYQIQTTPPATINYFCQLHPSETGTIQVVS